MQDDVTSGGDPRADQPTSLAHWWGAVRRTAPLAPGWFCIALTRVLIEPAINADALLIVADAIVGASAAADGEGQPTLAAQLRRLADLPRDLARVRAQRGH